jgi:hypothetical protein
LELRTKEIIYRNGIDNIQAVVYGGEFDLAKGHTKLKCQESSNTPDVHTVFSGRVLGGLQMQQNYVLCQHDDIGAGSFEFQEC